MLGTSVILSFIMSPIFEPLVLGAVALVTLYYFWKYD